MHKVRTFLNLQHISQILCQNEHLPLEPGFGEGGLMVGKQRV